MLPVLTAWLVVSTRDLHSDVLCNVRVQNVFLVPQPNGEVPGAHQAVVLTLTAHLKPLESLKTTSVPGLLTEGLSPWVCTQAATHFPILLPEAGGSNLCQG